MEQLPGLVLGVWALVVFWLAGNKLRAAWAMGMLGQVGWVSYSLWLRQYGLLISCAFYFAVYYRNWRRWADA